MLIQLPTETWIEILDWLRRRDLLKKLDQLWDRQFTPIVQDWLHKYTRNVKIGELATRKNGGLEVHLGSGHWEKVPIAQVEMPGNITSFRAILINHLNTNLWTLIRRMRPLFRNVYLEINSEVGLSTTTNTVLRLLMPLINDQIVSIATGTQMLQFLADHYPASIRFNARLLVIWRYNSDDNELLVNWLFTRREDGQPRKIVFCDEGQQFDDFCMKVRERFLDTTRQLASQFFVRLTNFVTIPAVYENARTGEQLTAKGVEHPGKRNITHHYWLMTNCPMGADGEWLARKMTELLDWDNRNQQRIIYIEHPTIDGPIETENN